MLCPVSASHKTVNYGDGQTQSYTFDAMGNRLSRQDSVSGTTNYAVNAANMLLSTTGTGASSYGNDADGNTLTGGGRTSTWDSQNRMVSCIITGNSSTFKYGADGLRRQKTTNSVTTDYAYDGTMMVREGVASGGTLSTVKATYLSGPRGPEYRRDDTQMQTDGQGHTFNGKASWYVYDGLGSVVGEVDPLGNLTSSPKYDVYGAVRGNSGTATTKQGFVGSLGHLSEPETGLIYMRARYYDPQLGRFNSEDPGKHGSNWFVYCHSNPVSWYDATGEDETLAGEMGVMSISGGLDANAAMDAVAAANFGDATLAGDAEWIGTAGEGKPVDFVLRKYGQDVAQTLKDSWDYYESSVSSSPGAVMKAWLHWNGEEFDAYLKCEQDITGDYSGFLDHPSPYIGPGD